MNAGLIFFRKMINNYLFMSYRLFIFMCCMIMMACQGEEITSLSVEDNRQQCQIGADITALARANNAGFEIGDSLGLFIVKWKSDSESDSLLSTGNFIDNMWFRLENTDDNWQPEHVIYFPNDNRNIDLYAYYPYQNRALGSESTLNLAIATNQSIGQNYTRSDFMVARTNNVSRTKEKVPLVFDHKFSQILFELVPGAGFNLDDLLSAKVKVINAITDATYDLSKATIAKPIAGNMRADITPAGTWIKEDNKLTGIMAIIIPQEIGSTTYIQLSLGSRIFTFKPSPVHTNSGCSRKFTMTVNNTELNVTTTINPWNNCPPIVGDFEENFVNYLQDFEPNPLDTIGTVLTLIDKRDSKSYRVVKSVDNRWWLGENLKYNNTTGSFCRAYNDSVENLNKFGYIYDWQTAQNSCPENWSLPSDNEWKTLEIALGMSPVIADQIYYRGTNQGAQLQKGGKSKLEIPLGGYYTDKFITKGTDANLWSSTPSGNKAWHRSISGLRTEIGRYNNDKILGFYVRCIFNIK